MERRILHLLAVGVNLSMIIAVLYTGLTEGFSGSVPTDPQGAVRNALICLIFAALNFAALLLPPERA